MSAVSAMMVAAPVAAAARPTRARVTARAASQKGPVGLGARASLPSPRAKAPLRSGAAPGAARPELAARQR